MGIRAEARQLAHRNPPPCRNCPDFVRMKDLRQQIAKLSSRPTNFSVERDGLTLFRPLPFIKCFFLSHPVFPAPIPVILCGFSIPFPVPPEGE